MLTLARPGRSVTPTLFSRALPAPQYFWARPQRLTRGAPLLRRGRDIAPQTHAVLVRRIRR